jgi:hypothetical protein
MDKDLLIWLYEQKDDIDAHLYGTGSYDRAKGTYRRVICTDEFVGQDYQTC